MQPRQTPSTGRTRRGVVAIVAMVLVATGTTAVGGSTAGAGGPRWAVGDCFATADVGTDSVDLASAVDCDEEHAVQVLVGAPLPSALATAGRAALVDPTNAARADLLTFVRATCTAAAQAEAIYPPKAAKRLAALFEKYDVDDWMPPAAGNMAWVLPDAAAFDAGATDLLCVHETNPAITGSSAGDIRDIATQQPVPTMRICQDFFDGNTRVDGVPCDGAHDIESLIWVSQDVTGKPADVLAWSDGDWKSLDDACREFATAVIGAKRKDALVNADTDPRQAPVGTTRFVNCRTFPVEETDAWAAGTIVTGAGKRKLAVTPT